MDPYMGTGYRSPEAREKRRAVKEDFLAPGFPVDAPPAPPASPPPIGAAAAGSAAVGPLAVVGSVAVGLGLGLWVKEDIDRFKKTAKRPFYDTVAWGGYDPAVLAEDEAVQEDYRLYGYARAFARTYTFASDHIDSNGNHSPLVWRGQNDGWSQWVLTCEDVGATIDGYASTAVSGFCSGNPAWGQTISPNCAVNNAAGERTWVNPPQFYCPGNPPAPGHAGVIASKVIGGTNAGVGHSANLVWSLSATVLTPAAAPQLVPQTIYEYGVGTTIKTPGWLFDDVEVPFPSHWGDWVAPSHTQPRSPEREADLAVVLPFALGHPFTHIVADGFPGTVTVPDVVIDPGTDTVTIVPPGSPPQYPNPSEEKEGKADSKMRRFISKGFVALNAATEANDFVQAMYQGLPKRLRRKATRAGVRPDLVLEDIWNHWDDWDSQKALEAFINNQIEDAIVGRFQGFKSRAYRKLPRGVGYGLTRTTVGAGDGLPFKMPSVDFETDSFGFLGFTIGA